MGAKICDAWAQDCTVYVFVGGDCPTDAGGQMKSLEFSDMCI